VPVALVACHGTSKEGSVTGTPTNLAQDARFDCAGLRRKNGWTRRRHREKRIQKQGTLTKAEESLNQANVVARMMQEKPEGHKRVVIMDRLNSDVGAAQR
jgi:hypothetical protein